MHYSKVLWVHNTKQVLPGSGSFLWAQLLAMKRVPKNVVIEPYYLNTKNVWEYFLYWKYVRNGLFDIIHVQFGSLLSYLVAYLSPNQKSLILTLRGSDTYKLETGPIRSQVHSRLAIFFTRKAITRYDKIIVMSYSMKRLVESWISGKSIFVITDGIDVNHFTVTGQETVRNKNVQFRVGIGSVDRQNPIKNIRFLEKVLNQTVYSKRVEIDYLTGIEPRNMPERIRRCDCVMLASVYEGWPNIIKESWACGVPTITSNVSDLKLFENKCHRVVNGFESEGWSKTLQEMMDMEISFSDLEELRKQALQFDIHNMVSKLIDIYEDCNNSNVRTDIR